MDGSNTKKLMRLVQLEIENSPDQSAESLVKKIARSDRTLIMDWALERLLLLVLAHQKADRRKNQIHPYQQFLGGFADLSSSLMLRDGTRLVLGEATVTDLRKRVKPAKVVIGARARRIMNLIEAMEPYSAIRQRLKVKRYCELKAAGITADEYARNKGKTV